MLSSFRNMVKRMLGRSGQGAHGDASISDMQNVSRSAVVGSGQGGALSDRMAEVLAKQQSIATGKLHLINLEGLKQRFGEQWESKVGRVASVMEASLQRHLSFRDFFCRIDDGAYVIIFERLTEREATIKCNLIAREVLQKLFGQAEDGTGVVIQTAVATVDGSIDVKSSTPLDVIAGLLDDTRHHSITLEGGEDEHLHQSNAMGGLQGKAPVIAARGGGPVDVDWLLDRAEGRVTNWQIYLPPKGSIIYHPTLEPSRSPQHTAVDLTSGTEWPPARLKKRSSVRFHDVKGVEIRYQPIWYAPRKAIVAYRCNLYLQSGDALIPAEDFVQDDDQHDRALKVDRLVLRRALSDLARLLGSGGKVIVIVPLHAATFGSPTAWRQFTEVLSDITHEMRMLTFIEIVDTVALLGDTRLPKSVWRLRSRVRRIIAQVPLYFRDFSQLRAAGFTGACASVAPPCYSDAEISRMIGTFADGASEQGLRAILADVRSASALTCGMSKGVEYLSGPLISEEQQLPSAVKAFDLVDVKFARH